MALRTINPVTGPVKTQTAEVAVTRGYGVVAGSAVGNVKPASAAGQRCLGVANETTDAGLALGVTVAGETVAIAGAAIAFDTDVKMDATGKFVPVTKGAATTEEVAGRSRSVAAASGDEFILYVAPYVLTTN